MWQFLHKEKGGAKTLLHLWKLDQKKIRGWSSLSYYEFDPHPEIYSVGLAIKLK